MPLSSWALLSLVGGVCAWPLAAYGQVDLFQEVPGVRELSGQVMARPIQPETWVRKGRTPQEAAQLQAAAQAGVAPFRIRVLPGTDIHVLRVPAGSNERAFCSELTGTGLYEFAAPDWIVYPTVDGELRPDDPLLRSQWHLDRIAAPRAWTAGAGDGSITCAFVDTGIDRNHPDLQPLLVPGFNAVSNIPQSAGGLVDDVNGHGTGVAGAAAAMGNNNFGGSGVCWTARIMPIRATNYSSGSAFISNILYGASWAAYNGAKVVSVSYAGVENPAIEPTGQVIRNTYGGLLLWAAGNSSANLSGFDHETTTVVGSTTPGDTMAPDTNYGRAIDIMAPGVSIYVPAIGGGYVFRSGTSMATPVAAGVLALAWSAAPHLTPTQAMNMLYLSCSPMEPVHPANNTGWGRVDAASAVQMARGEVIPRLPTFMPAAAIPPVLIGGLEARYYSATGAAMIPMLGGPSLGQGTVPQINFAGPNFWFTGCPLPSGFAAGFKGYLQVPVTGVYTLTLSSRDGSRLVIDGQTIVNNDGIHASRLRSGTAWLERGLHQLDCQYFTSTSEPELIFRMRGAGLGEFVVPGSMFTYSPRIATPGQN